VSGNEIVLDLASASEYLPAWWDLYNVGSCRPTSLGMNVFNPTAVNCLDWGAGVEVGGIGAYNLFQRSDNTARIVAVIVVAPSFLQNLVAGQEYFSFNITINHQKSAGGTGVCLGCETPACIVFTSINITTPILANNRKITGPAYGGDSDFCSWQGGGITAGSGAACTAATPTAKRTWGAVKALYR